MEALKATSPQRGARATSYATLKDLRGYIKCLIANGVSQAAQNKCYNFGDNGTGAWGDNTAQLKTPMCALSPQAMAAKWGSSNAARGKLVLVQFSFGGVPRSVICEVRDKGPAGVVDLNPAALLKAGLPSDTELNVPATYQWIA